MKNLLSVWSVYDIADSYEVKNAMENGYIQVEDSRNGYNSLWVKPKENKGDLKWYINQQEILI